jgi:hypothetical protein
LWPGQGVFPLPRNVLPIAQPKCRQAADPRDQQANPEMASEAEGLGAHELFHAAKFGPGLPVPCIQ